MKNTMKKIVLARAHIRARAGRIFGLLSSNLMVFEFSQRYEVWRAPRAQRRARQKNFCHHILHEILHLLDILNVFLPLELVAVDAFEIHVFS